MYCVGCGSETAEGTSFCANCGRAIAAVPPAYGRGRIGAHLQLVGILWLAIGAFRMIPALFVFAISVVPIIPPEVPLFVRGFLPVIGVLLAAGGLLSIATGAGLLSRSPWARMLAIVFGGLNLVDIPFGTALGIYTLWVLLPEESEKEYHRLATPISR